MMPNDEKKLEAYDYRHAAIRRADFVEEIKHRGGRRLYACRKIGDIADIIEALPDSNQKKELLNLNALLLRMILVENDGADLSPSTLNRF